MDLSRRQTLILASAAAAAGAMGAGRSFAQTMDGDRYPAGDGELVIRPLEHASLVLVAPGGMVIYVDPVGGAAKYDGLPRPELVLITHEHPDHLDVPTLQAIAGEPARLLTSASVHAKLPADLQARATAIAPGEATTANGIPIEAIPAYNITPDRLQFHPRERGDNGYVLGLGDLRVYVAGDTEDTPEVRGLRDIDIAFLPMNLPYTMTVEQAAAAVAAFEPGLVYPYHYRGSDLDAFEAAVTASGAATKVVRANWYPAT